VDISRSDFFKLPLYKDFKGYFGHSNHVGFYDNILFRMEKIEIAKINKKRLKKNKDMIMFDNNI